MKWRVAGWAVVAIVALLAAMTVLTARPADPALWPPAAGAPGVDIHVVSHGYHFGIIVERAAMAEAAERGGQAALAAVAQRFADYRWLEIGWGDEGFYRSVPDVASLTVRLAVRCSCRATCRWSMWSGWTVRRAMCFQRPTSSAFRSRTKASRGCWTGSTRASAAGRAGRRSSHSGPGFTGPSLFYRGVDAFHTFNVCNHWVARLLSAAGVPTAPVLATLPPGLFLDLKWRAGLNPLPKP
jgi:hypothetical protein